MKSSVNQNQSTSAAAMSTAEHPGKAISIRCPAKLNLGLMVSPRRSDGYHDIDSWFAPLSLADLLTIEDAPEPAVELSGLTAGIATRFEDNLAGGAAMAMAEIVKKPPNVRIHIDKLIPTGGGLGGGSSDAAGTMLALRSLWQMKMTTEQMAALAAGIGSDVPFFLHGVSARCRGRGERIEPLVRTASLFAVLIIPPTGTSTAAVYRAFDQLPAQQGRTMDYAGMVQAPAEVIDHMIFNDLEPAAFAVAPWLNDLQRKAAKAVNQRVHMSGSGSTLFTLHDRADEAEAAVERLAASLAGAVELLPVRVIGSRDGTAAAGS